MVRSDFRRKCVGKILSVESLSCIYYFVIVWLCSYITNLIRKSHQLELRRKGTPSGHKLIKGETWILSPIHYQTGPGPDQAIRGNHLRLSISDYLNILLRFRKNVPGLEFFIQFQPSLKQINFSPSLVISIVLALRIVKCEVSPQSCLIAVISFTGMSAPRTEDINQLLDLLSREHFLIFLESSM